ncbi:MAG: neutral/alkaline non-lysosomal ceramidase N-terminal domain-containing protein [Planctomycetaceae bacterium]|nr:neutral/alkaline non-lysosomal ceramidase N-terminal domain-containing protein [Planctomycetaceae bacterium]
MPHVDTPQSRVNAGVARVDITPPVGMYHRMWGAAKHDRSTGIHRPLCATALVLSPLNAPSETDDLLVIVAVDHCLLWGDAMQALLDRLAKSTGVRRERLQVCFSHTHGAGLMGLDRVNLPGGDLIPPYLDALAEKLTQIIVSAREHRQPATVVFGTGRCDLARHRDYWDASTLQWVCGFHPGGRADDTVLVAKLSGDDGKTLATLVNYACHPTTLAWDNTLVSPDYIGAMREVVESATDAPCVFIQGASGDLGPRDGFVGDPAVADRNGRQLGYAALSALESLPAPLTRHEYRGPVISGATIGVWQHVPLDETQRARLARWSIEQLAIDLPLRPDLPTVEGARREITELEQQEKLAHERGEESIARDRRAQIERLNRWLVRLAGLPSDGQVPLYATIAHLGEASLVFLESEHYQRLQTTLRQRVAPRPIVVGTVVNGSVHTYFPGREVYGTGVYQETVAVLAPGCLETVIKTLGERLHRQIAGA